MWIFTVDGFYSVVQHNKNSDMVQIRARRRDDLERLSVATGVDSADIIKIDDADYRWRLNVHREDFADYTSRAVYNIRYETNVKGTLSRNDKKRKSAMMDVWRAMYKLQEASTTDDVD